MLAEFPAQCGAAVTLVASRPLPRLVVHHVVVAGMGGSAMGGELLKTLAVDRLGVPVTVWRDYGMPAFVDSSTLVLGLSYSGNTEETLSAVEAALRRGAPLAVLTSGGDLEALATAHGLPIVRLPTGLMPRLALGYLFFPLLGLLEMAGLTVATASERDEALEVLKVMGSELRPERPGGENHAKQLAMALYGKIPVFYGSAATEAAAYRWKTAVEENAKLLAFHGRLPEMNHNEIEGWGDPVGSDFYTVFLRDPDEGQMVDRRVRLSRELIVAHAGGVAEVWPQGRGQLGRQLSLIYLGDWISYYLALLRAKDPWSVPTLEALKRRLRETEAMISLERSRPDMLA